MTTMRRAAITATAAVVFALAFVALPGAYVKNGPKWGVKTVNYYINPANADVTATAAENAIQAGAATWSSQSNADFRFYYMGRTTGTKLANNGKNEVFFRGTSNGSVIAETYWWADSTGKLIDADIVFYDGGMRFFTGSSACSGSAGIYLEDTAAHEFGHALGLGHSSVKTATMYYQQTWCSTSGRTLDSDDLAGVEALYPPSASNTAPSVSISSPTSGASVAAGTPVTFSGAASDKEDGVLTSQITWTSNLSGSLGSGGTVKASLTSGTHQVTARVTDSAGQSTSKSVTVTVAGTATVAGGIQLTAKPYWTGSRWKTLLQWSGASTASVSIFRDGGLRTTTTNDGKQQDGVKWVPGTYTYQLCNYASTTCSTLVTVVFK